ncbi:hypothetical protein [Geotalea uraniireducens]|uniref:PEP-CTERM protein-sorting domain-containing protein n=1 Tax=Geotalea uraniireducens (strain Rf4) TaxID=351605 RepID=A5G4N7_GEOUR|nr:hypothetical protein [Geotalea uraniireducens]ABQ26755.1 hypothetical protein Gura_2577 [Geotalea uraniireducens Rf4]
MKKKMITLLAAAMLTMSAASSAMAAFAQGDLIRVVYDTLGTKEIATNLGSVSALTSYANGSILGGGIDATTLAQFGGSSYSDLRVAYFSNDNATSSAWVSGTGDLSTTTAPTNGSLKYGGYKTNFASTINQYNLFLSADGKVATLDNKSLTNSFFNKMDNKGAATGGFANFLPTKPAGGVVSLAALATTGYVDQALYTWGSTISNSANLGVRVGDVQKLTLRTLADGSTAIMTNAASTPIPPAFLLMGSGLLGMVGIRRKMTA